jgi:DNA-binding transcriptional MerR regulator
MPTTTNPVPSVNAPADAGLVAPPAPSIAPPTTESTVSPRLLRIQEVAAEVGATARAIRYYEEIGLLQPAARSEGDYRLYDQSDLERVRHIRELRDTAGFSLAEIGQMLEDEDHRAANRAAYRATEDPSARAEILADSIARAERSIAILRVKAGRLDAMIEESEARRQRLSEKLGSLTGSESDSAARARTAEPDRPLMRRAHRSHELAE